MKKKGSATVAMKDFLKLPLFPIGDIPVGSQLIPASSIFENYEGKGFIFVPPECVLRTKKDFNEFKDKLINSIIDTGLKDAKKKAKEPCKKPHGNKNKNMYGLL